MTSRSRERYSFSPSEMRLTFLSSLFWPLSSTHHSSLPFFLQKWPLDTFGISGEAVKKWEGGEGRGNGDGG